jgi:hypothetical protein
MRAMIPFTWQEEYLLKGGVKPVTRVFSDLMVLEIPEFCATEAPPVVSWIETDGEAGGARNPIDVRMIDGQFYMQAANRMAPAADFGGDCLNGPVNEQYRRMFHHLAYLGGNVQKHLDAFSAALGSVSAPRGDVAPSGEGVELFLSNDREARERLFRDAAEGFVIIDGAVWIRVCEPTVVIHDDVKLGNAVWNGTVDTVTCAICVTSSVYGERFVSGTSGISIGLPDTTTIYSITEWVEAAAAHRRIVHPRQDRYRLTRHFEDVQIHDPTVLRFDPVCSPVSRTISYALKAFGTDMASWSRGEANMFMDIRDELAEFEASGDVQSLERAVQLTVAFMERSYCLDASAKARVTHGLARWTLDDAGIALSAGERQTLLARHP